MNPEPSPPTSASAATTTLDSLSITGSSGSGIHNGGRLTLTGSILTGNGRGIHNRGRLTVTDSTLSGSFGWNSPGGGIRASEEILKALSEFKEENDVPQVVWMSDVAASGGYYLAMSADTVRALPTTIIGSIGVLAQVPNFRRWLEERGIKVRFRASLEDDCAAVEALRQQLWHGIQDRIPGAQRNGAGGLPPARGC